MSATVWLHASQAASDEHLALSEWQRNIAVVMESHERNIRLAREAIKRYKTDDGYDSDSSEIREEKATLHFYKIQLFNARNEALKNVNSSDGTSYVTRRANAG